LLAGLAKEADPLTARRSAEEDVMDVTCPDYQEDWDFAPSPADDDQAPETE
jgi:hypothetical protein